MHSSVVPVTWQCDAMLVTCGKTAERHAVVSGQPYLVVFAPSLDRHSRRMGVLSRPRWSQNRDNPKIVIMPKSGYSQETWLPKRRPLCDQEPKKKRQSYNRAMRSGRQRPELLQQSRKCCMQFGFVTLPIGLAFTLLSSYTLTRGFCRR